MTNLEKLRLRYMQDAQPVRLGGLAANMARIASFSRNAEHEQVVSDILQQSKWFIEWTAVQLDIERSAELVQLQIELAVWQLQANDNWQNDVWRLALAENANRWSQRLLTLSGLLGK